MAIHPINAIDVNRQEVVVSFSNGSVILYEELKGSLNFRQCILKPYTLGSKAKFIGDEVIFIVHLDHVDLYMKSQ